MWYSNIFDVVGEFSEIITLLVKPRFNDCIPKTAHQKKSYMNNLILQQIGEFKLMRVLSDAINKSRFKASR